MKLLKGLVAAAIAGIAFIAIGSTDAAAQAQKQKKGANSYAACKAKLSQVPPCSHNWTRNCAAQCGGR
jgi:hypothetical protein